MLTTQVSKFLDKNYDQVRQDVLDLFIQSKNKVRRNSRVLFGSQRFSNISQEQQNGEEEPDCFFLFFVFPPCVQMVSNLFLAHTEVAGQQRGGHARKSSTVTRKYQAPTVSSKFQQSLLELVEKMERWRKNDTGDDARVRNQQDSNHNDHLHHKKKTLLLLFQVQPLLCALHQAKQHEGRCPNTASSRKLVNTLTSVFFFV